MPLQGAGRITVAEVLNEIAPKNGSYSLRSLSATACKSTPDNISEFYGYSLGFSVGWMVRAGGGGGGTGGGNGAYYGEIGNNATQYGAGGGGSGAGDGGIGVTYSNGGRGGNGYMVLNFIKVWVQSFQSNTNVHYKDQQEYYLLDIDP